MMMTTYPLPFLVFLLLFLLVRLCAAERLPLLLFDEQTLGELRQDGVSSGASGSSSSLPARKLAALLARTHNWQQHRSLNLHHWLAPSAPPQVVEPTDMWPLQALTARIRRPTTDTDAISALIQVLDAHWTTEQQGHHDHGGGVAGGGGAGEDGVLFGGGDGAQQDPHCSAHAAVTGGRFAAIVELGLRQRQWGDRASNDGACLCTSEETCEEPCHHVLAAVRAARAVLNVVLTADLIFEACAPHEQAFIAEHVLRDVASLLRARQCLQSVSLSLDPAWVATNEAIFAGSLFLTHVRHNHAAVSARVSASLLSMDALAAAETWVRDAWSHLRTGLLLLNDHMRDGSLDGGLGRTLLLSQCFFEAMLMAQRSVLAPKLATLPMAWVKAHLQYIEATVWPHLRRNTARSRDSNSEAPPSLPLGQTCVTHLACSPAAHLRFIDTHLLRNGEATWLADRVSEAELGLDSSHGEGDASMQFESRHEGKGSADNVCMFSLLMELASFDPQQPSITPFSVTRNAWVRRFHHQGLTVLSLQAQDNTAPSLFAMRSGFPSGDVAAIARTIANSAYAHMIPDLVSLIHSTAHQEGSFVFSPGGAPFIIAPRGVTGNVMLVRSPSPPLPQEPVEQPVDVERDEDEAAAFHMCAGNDDLVPVLDTDLYEHLGPAAGDWRGVRAMLMEEAEGAAGAGADETDATVPIPPAHPRLLYSSAFASQALVVAVTTPTHMGRHPNLQCSVRVAFLPFPDTLILIDMAMLASTGSAPVSGTVEQQFRSTFPWDPTPTPQAAVPPTASTMAGHKLMVAPAIAVDADIGVRTEPAGKGSFDGAGSSSSSSSSSCTLHRHASDNNTLIVTHAIADSAQQPTHTMHLFSTLLAGHERMWSSFRVRCDECSLSAAKKGRVRLMVELTPGDRGAGGGGGVVKFPLHLSRHDACPT